MNKLIAKEKDKFDFDNYSNHSEHIESGKLSLWYRIKEVEISRLQAFKDARKKRCTASVKYQNNNSYFWYSFFLSSIIGIILLAIATLEVPDKQLQILLENYFDKNTAIGLLYYFTVTVVSLLTSSLFVTGYFGIKCKQILKEDMIVKH